MSKVIQKHITRQSGGRKPTNQMGGQSVRAQRLSRSSGKTFDPLNYNPDVLLDPSSMTFNGSNILTAWADVSGNGRDIVDLNGLSLPLGSILKGYKTVNFNDLGGIEGDLIPSWSDFSAFIVLSNNDTGGGSNVALNVRSTDRLSIGASSGDWHASFYDGSYHNYSAAITESQFTVFGMILNSSIISGAVEGTALTPGGASIDISGNSGRYWIGSRNGSPTLSKWNGEIAEVFLKCSAVSSAEFGEIMTGYQTKYGVV